MQCLHSSVLLSCYSENLAILLCTKLVLIRFTSVLVLLKLLPKVADLYSFLCDLILRFLYKLLPFKILLLLIAATVYFSEALKNIEKEVSDALQYRLVFRIRKPSDKRIY